MSLTKTAQGLIEQRGCGTVDDIMPDLSGVSRHQAIKALQNAAFRGLLVCDGPTRTESGRRRAPSMYRPPKSEFRHRISSVWELGSAA